LIVADFVHTQAQELFGDKYEYRLCVSTHDPLEKLAKLEKPVWTTILGDESSVIHDLHGTLENEILINVTTLAIVESNNLRESLPFLEDIEKMKMLLLSNEFIHKDHEICGGVYSQETPAFSASHDIDFSFGAPVLRCQFAIILKIYSEADDD